MPVGTWAVDFCLSIVLGSKNLMGIKFNFMFVVHKMYIIYQSHKIVDRYVNYK